jgi:hypothetical protein
MGTAERLRQSVGPFRLVVLGLAALLSAIASLVSLPPPLRITFIAGFGAVLFATLGSLVQSLRYPGHGVITWHLSREPEYVRTFLREALRDATERRAPLDVDAMGIKARTVSDVLDSHAATLDWSTARVRFLLLRTGSDGARHRCVLEGRTSMDLTTDRGLEAARDLQTKVRDTYHSERVAIKVFDFLPSYYIIRVDRLMLVGMYLREKGTLSPYMILRSEPDSVFASFRRYFDGVFESELARDYRDPLLDARPGTATLEDGHQDGLPGER